MWPLIRRAGGVQHWLRALILGAVAPTAVAFLVIFPLKGLAVDPKLIVGGLIVNGAWGVGLALIMRGLQKF